MTTTGNPISCAAGLAVLGIVRGGEVTANARARGAQLRALLAGYARAERPGAGRIGDVRGRGLSLGIEFVTGAGSSDADPDLTAKVAYRAWQLGVIAYPVRGNVLELTPPLAISAESIERAAGILTTAIDDAGRGAVSDVDIAPFQGW
jgi:4-aminobutyrate aminotransferase